MQDVEFEAEAEDEEGERMMMSRRGLAGGCVLCVGQLRVGCWLAAGFLGAEDTPQAPLKRRHKRMTPQRPARALVAR